MWWTSPESLFRHLTVFPHKNDSLEEKLNALTRVLIIVVLILAILKYRHWPIILGVGLALIIYIYLTKQRECLVEGFNEDPNSESFKYYQRAPLSSLFKYECSAGIPLDEPQVVAHNEVTSSPIEAPQEAHFPTLEERRAQPPPQVEPPRDKPVRVEPRLKPQDKPKPRKQLSAADEERRSWDVLRKQQAVLDQTMRKSMARSLF